MPTISRRRADLQTEQTLDAEVQPLCNGSALRKASRRLAQLYGDVLSPTGLRQSQHSLLAHIDRADEPTLTKLAEDMVLDRSALSHNLKPLMRDGFVALEPDVKDKRARRVVLTPAGRRKLTETKGLWKLAHARFELVYGSQKSELLRVLLAEIYSPEFEAKYLSGFEPHVRKPAATERPRPAAKRRKIQNLG
jgi:DNA-binding MarR family transcriptional regulator